MKWWSLVILSRKAIFALFVALLPEFTVYQMTAAFLLVVFYLGLHVYFRPFKFHNNNELEYILLVSLAIILFLVCYLIFPCLSSLPNQSSGIFVI